MKKLIVICIVSLTALAGWAQNLLQPDKLTTVGQVTEQTIALDAGLYELAAIMAGRGRAILRIGDFERSVPISAEGGTYGLLAKWPGGNARCAIEVNGSVKVSDISLLPASDRQQQDWDRQEADFAQFGFIAFNAQRPLPGAETASETIPPARDLEAMTDRVVFRDARLDAAVQVKNVDRLVDWLGAQGFEVLDADRLRFWMLTKVQEGAYGSVLVLPTGIMPWSIIREAGKNGLWYRFMTAGGRIVWTGGPAFYTVQSARLEIPTHETAPLAEMGLPWGWASPGWGRHEPVTLTEQAKAWGIEVVASSICGTPNEYVTLPLSQFTMRDSGKLASASYFLNLNPAMPWSGVIAYQHSLDYNNDACMRDVWRLSHYVGTPVDTIPPMPPRLLPPPKPAFDIVLSASDIEGRTRFARGEPFSISLLPNTAGPFDAARIQLADANRIVKTIELRTIDQAIGSQLQTMIETQPFAFGDYSLSVEIARDGKPLARRQMDIGIHQPRRDPFAWEIWAAYTDNEHRNILLRQDLAEAGMSTYHVANPLQLDEALRGNSRMSHRAHADGLRKGENHETAPDKFIRQPDGTFRKWGTNPRFGISHPDSRAVGRQQMMEHMHGVAGHPAYSGYVLTNDDFSSLHYGIDYSKHNLDAFRSWTGQNPALERPEREPGIVPDNDPWLLWCLYTLEHVSGGWNKMQTLAVTAVDPDTRIGPIPGGMQIPVLHMWPAGQYPPLNFGDKGHNLIAFYYYNSYWQPLTTNTCWIECARMGNRDLPVWVMPDVMRPLTTYFRSNLYHLLAGGAEGLSYFIYSQRSPEAWAEVKHQWPIIERIGPVQAALEPKGRRVALMHSVTTDIFDQGNWLMLPYAYANLLQAHYQVDIIAEEEVRDGICASYDAVLLYRTRYLRQSVFDALAKHAADGGLILVDRTVPLDIPGAVRLDIDLAMGDQETLGIPPEGAHAARPGPGDYAIPERVAAIQSALSRHVAPAFQAADTNLIAHPFEIDGVSYMWFVNALDHDQYTMGQKAVSSRSPDLLADLSAWDKEIFQREPTFDTSVTFETLPGVPYDLITGRRLSDATPGEKAELALSMERFGGMLVAFYPQPIETMTLDVPKQATSLQALRAIVRVGSATEPIPGMVPVRLTLVSPSRQLSPLSGVLGTAEGEAIFEWTPAVNDERGPWTLTATELASGREVVQTIELK